MDFSKLLNFFREKPPALPGEPEYNAEFCKILLAASSAEEASIWQLDSINQLHPVYGTNFIPEEVQDVILGEGVGVGGTVVVTRQSLATSQPLTNSRQDQQFDKQHDQRLDKLINKRRRFRTYSMISAPILFGDQLYGVVNILNHTSGGAFPSEWQEKLSTVGVMYAAALAAADRLCLYDESSTKSGTDKRNVAKFSKYKTIVIGTSCPIQDVLQTCVKAAKSDAPVLILGETGTGKDLAAKRIHEAGNRASGPFVAMNCAAVTDTLLESELFGHVKGAFSGATDSRQGKFVAASGGTLFLDEIGSMSQTFQAKILRVLQEMKLSPVGSEKTVTCDVRVISATNQDLWKKVEEGSFREDLFYRLCGIEILMPSLRERVEDIPLLVNFFLNREYAKKKKHNPSYQLPRIEDETVEMLMSFSWPGNVRQLEIAVTAALDICETDEIQSSDFPDRIQNAITNLREEPIHYQSSSVDHSLQKQRSRYLEALNLNKIAGRWNISAAARHVGLKRKTFENHLKKMNLI